LNRARVIASDRVPVAARTSSVIFRFFAFWLPKIYGTTVNIRNTCSGQPSGAGQPVESSRSRRAGALRQPAIHRKSPLPMRAQNAMQTTTMPMPDISVDFMTWLNAELRKRIEADDDSHSRGLVNRLKNYFGRPVETESSES
jgi:hypothetical protein